MPPVMMSSPLASHLDDRAQFQGVAYQSPGFLRAREDHTSTYMELLSGHHVMQQPNNLQERLTSHKPWGVSPVSGTSSMFDVRANNPRSVHVSLTENLSTPKALQRATRESKDNPGEFTGAPKSLPTSHDEVLASSLGASTGKKAIAPTSTGAIRTVLENMLQDTLRRNSQRLISAFKTRFRMQRASFEASLEKMRLENQSLQVRLTNRQMSFDP